MTDNELFTRLFDLIVRRRLRLRNPATAEEKEEWAKIRAAVTERALGPGAGREGM